MKQQRMSQLEQEATANLREFASYFLFPLFLLMWLATEVYFRRVDWNRILSS